MGEGESEGGDEGEDEGEDEGVAIECGCGPSMRRSHVSTYSAWPSVSKLVKFVVDTVSSAIRRRNSALHSAGVGDEGVVCRTRRQPMRRRQSAQKTMVQLVILSQK